MGHAVRLFIGPRAALRPFVALVPAARVFALTPSAPLFVLPWDDEIVDAFHLAYGTGEWLDIDGTRGLHLTTSDLTFASRASSQTALAWIETGYHGGAGEQVAAAWIDGGLQMKPNLLREGARRPQSLRPINMALRMLGVLVKAPARDEFEAFDLDGYRSNEAILARATPVTV